MTSMTRLQLINIFYAFKDCIERRISEFEGEKNKHGGIDVRRVKYLEGQIVGAYRAFEFIVVDRPDVAVLKKEKGRELKDIVFIAIYGVKAS